MEPTLKVAKQFPDVKFEHATGFKRAERHHLQRPLLRGPLHHRPDRRQDVEDGHRRLHRLLPDPGSDHGHQLLHARRAVGQSGLQGQDRLGQLLVRTRARKPTPPRRCSTRAPTSSPSTPTARRRCRSPQERGLHGFGQASDMIKFAPKAQLTAIVDNWGPTTSSASRRCSTAPGSRREAGAASRTGMVADGALHQHAGRRGSWPRRPRPRSGRRAPSLHGPDRQAGRHRGRVRPARPRRRPAPRHELLRQGHRREGPAVHR